MTRDAITLLGNDVAIDDDRLTEMCGESIGFVAAVSADGVRQGNRQRGSVRNRCRATASSDGFVSVFDSVLSPVFSNTVVCSCGLRRAPRLLFNGSRCGPGIADRFAFALNCSAL